MIADRDRLREAVRLLKELASVAESAASMADWTGADEEIKAARAFIKEHEEKRGVVT